jgi:hypothetical protein
MSGGEKVFFSSGWTSVFKIGTTSGEGVAKIIKKIASAAFGY